MKVLEQFSVEQLKLDAKDRTWLFKVVCGWCVVFGGLCLLLSLIALIKSLFVPTIDAKPALVLIMISAIIIGSTALMWKFNVWGRNIAVVTVASMSWVMSGVIRSRMGGDMISQVLTIVFVAMALACFTSPAVRAMFSKSETDTEEGKP